MMPCTRGDPPDELARDGAKLANDYAAKRQAEPGHPFRWPQRLLVVVRGALSAMTAHHCSYCDGHPLNETGVATVDHFKPKSEPAFYELVCEWTNLYLTCTKCNHAKREHWDEFLLRPDELGFAFERYFEFRFDSGELHPAPTAGPEDQHRARRTIEIFHLNRGDTCRARLRAVKWIRGNLQDDPNEYPYRFLIPLCQLA